MTPSTTTTSRATTTSTLHDAGFSPTEVARLLRARARYTPYLEYFSVREYQRLSFLRWQVQRGLLQP